MLEAYIIIVVVPFLIILAKMIIDFFKPKTLTNCTNLETEEPVVNDILTPKLTEDYLTFENYIGQQQAIEYLSGHIRLAQEKQEPLPHILLWGNGGLGKSTLVKAIAHHLGGRYLELVPANMRNSKELFGVFLKKACPRCGRENPFSCSKCLYCKEAINVYFTPVCTLQENDIVFLEECHGLKEEIEEALYSVMQDGYLVVRYNGVDQAVNFPKITIAGATTKLGDLNKPFRDRFKISIQLTPYTTVEIKQISKIYATKKNLTITEEALEILSKISYGIPRMAKKYVDDASTLSSMIEAKHLNKILSLLNVDYNGLDTVHKIGMKHILERMKTRKNGGAGTTSIATACGVPKAVWEEVYEPPLVYHEFIFMGSNGRRLTEKALKEYFDGVQV
jgi:Holliday junction DNA helicase RuvB